MVKRKHKMGAGEILECIPEGKGHAVSRTYLCRVAGRTDRKTRAIVQKLREETVILSNDDGTGYYIPTEDDREELAAYIARETSRALSILKGLKTAKKLLLEMDGKA